MAKEQFEFRQIAGNIRNYPASMESDRSKVRHFDGGAYVWKAHGQFRLSHSGSSRHKSLVRAWLRAVFGVVECPDRPMLDNCQTIQRT
ncbi:MAG: hypothetical protein MK110_04025 [Fuerstiella sp.]|nr:hypothetical protein [Fuerstiella sp.]